MDFTTLTLPSEWSAFSDEAKAWLYGLLVMAGVRLVRAAIRWFKRVGTERID